MAAGARGSTRFPQTAEANRALKKQLVAATGGGVVEGYPHDNEGKRCAVLYDGTRSLFERAGFGYVRSKGTKNCVMRTTVPPAG